jgi:hypothetical protein
MRNPPSRKPRLVPSLIGLLAGGVVGFLLRPSAFLVGQLPLETVITRGEQLKGLDRLYKPTAEISFNYMLVGAIVGLLCGVVISYFLPKARN